MSEVMSMLDPLKLEKLIIQPRMQPFSATFAINTPLTHQTSHGSQTLQGRLNVMFTVQSQAFIDHSAQSKQVTRRIIHVSLDGSEYGAPSDNMLDQSDMRGFYLETLRYWIWLQSPGAAPDPTKPAPDWTIVQEAPDTGNQTGSITSSINWGFDASAGVFGDVPTANVGANIGVSNSTSHSLQDFTFIQSSNSTTLDHKLLMSQTGDGNPYSTSADLLNQWQDPFVGIQLRPLPELAKSNVPLVGQAIWMNNTDAGLVDKLSVQIMVMPHWVLIEGKYDGMFHTSLDTFSPTINLTQDIDFKALSAN